MPSDKYYQHLKKQGLCTECGKTNNTKYAKCSICIEKNNKYKKEVYRPNSKKDRSDYNKDWHQKNKGKRRSDTIKRKYGITSDEYTKILESQGGVCAICGTDNPGTGFSNFAVDHCHITDKIRGLLCSSCNPALGLFKDDTKILEKAISYVMAFPLK